MIPGTKCLNSKAARLTYAGPSPDRSRSRARYRALAVTGKKHVPVAEQK